MPDILIPFWQRRGYLPQLPAKLSPVNSNNPPSNPPFRNVGRITSTIAAVGFAWTLAADNANAYQFFGGNQPFSPRYLEANFLNNPPSNPVFVHEGRDNWLNGVIVGMWQPDVDLTAYRFAGGFQPTALRQLNPTSTNNPPNNPPFSPEGRSIWLPSLVSTWQPDPWIYSYSGPVGGLQPYGPRQLSPNTLNNPPNNPPTVYAGYFPYLNNVISVWQPDPWVYNYPPLGRQPYGPGSQAGVQFNNPSNNPPFSPEGRSIWLPSLVSTWQPDPWIYSYAGPAGGLQPYAPRQVDPNDLNNPPSNPPFASRKEILQPIEVPPLPWQPKYFVQVPAAAQNPFAPLWLSSVLGTWAPLDPLPTLPKLNYADLLNNPPNNPQFVHPERTVVSIEIKGINQPDPWIYNYPTLGRQPYGPGSQAGIQFNNPPNNPPTIYAGSAPYLNSVIQVWQPDPWIYSYAGPAGGLQPYASRQVDPNDLNNPPNNPPFENAGRLIYLPTLLLSWQPPDPLPTLPKINYADLLNNPPNNPPLLQRLILPYPETVPLPWQPRYFVQTPVVAQNPYAPAWLSSVLGSWIPADLLPTLPKLLTGRLLNVTPDNPPGISFPAIVAVDDLALPTLPGRLIQPGITAVQNPYGLAWLSGILSSWQPSDPLPTLPKLNFADLLNNPPNNPPFIQSRLTAWTWGPLTFYAQSAGDLIQSPVGFPYPLPFWLSAVLGSWQPPDPLPTLGTKLQPSISNVTPSNPPGSFFPVIIYVDDVVLPDGSVRRQLIPVTVSVTVTTLHYPFFFGDVGKMMGRM